MTELISSNRSAYWDNAKGVLICFVVLGHYLFAYQENLSVNLIISLIYFFHMPAFVLISGFFSKNERSSAAGAIVRLGVIYVIFNTLMMIYAAIFENSLPSLVQPYNSYWYLVALIIWRLTVKQAAKIKGIVGISIIVALLIGFWSDISNVFALSRVICFYPFFLVGYKLPLEKINAFIDNRKREDYLKGILLLIITLGLAFVCALSFYPNVGIYLMDSYATPAFLLNRIVIFVIAALMIICMGYLIPQKSIPLITKWGRNSLAIYVLHRMITLVFVRIFPAETFTPLYILFALFACTVTLAVLGADTVSRVLNSIISRIADMVYDSAGKINEHKKAVFRCVMILLMILVLILPLIQTVFQNADQNTEVTAATANYPVLSDKQSEVIQNAVSIAFVGDLILLQDQVKTAYSIQRDEYEFSSVFTYAKRYLSDADLAIGVFEGPMAGKEKGYSTSNYDDGLPLSLNFPDSFADAVKAAGIDFVSTANNHLLDKGTEGAIRTLDILDEAGLGHTGTYRSAEEKGAVQILMVDGLKIAVLAYTYGVNDYEESYFLTENKDVTSILVDPSSQYFDDVKESVISDFNHAKESNPDVIVVLPHMGTQFSHETDSYQETWNNIFIAAGADVILGDHSHAVQPVEFRAVEDDDGTPRQAVIVNCTGNFVNSYTEYDGDATAITEIYLDSVSGEVVCAGIVPMWTQAQVNGNYRALPIFDILNDADLQKQISTNDMDRVTEVQSIVTSVMLGTELTLDQAQNRYYLFPDGYVRQPAAAIVMTEEMAATDLYKLIDSSDTVCFVGDSLTCGSENGGYGWYEPLMEAFPNVAVSREAWGGATTQTLLKNAEKIAAHGADTYVIAIGTNDVRYRDTKECAMSADSFIANIRVLIEDIKAKNPTVEFVFISPWLALDNDPYSALSINDRDAMLSEYGSALKHFCDENDYLFIDPNPSIRKTFSLNVTSDYLLDHIHPNASKGIALYSKAVIEYGSADRVA